MAGSFLDRIYFIVLFGAQLFNTITDILLAVALLGVYLGLRHARSSDPPRHNKLVYRICTGCVILLVTVQVMVFIFGLFEAFNVDEVSYAHPWSATWGYSFAGYQYWTVIYGLGIFAASITCIAALVIFTLSIVARKKTRAVKHLRRVSPPTEGLLPSG